MVTNFEHWDYRWGVSVGKQDRQGIDLPRRFTGLSGLGPITNPGKMTKKPLSLYARAKYNLDVDRLAQDESALSTIGKPTIPFLTSTPLQNFDHSKIGLSNLFCPTRL